MDNKFITKNRDLSKLVHERKVAMWGVICLVVAILFLGTSIRVTVNFTFGPDPVKASPFKDSLERLCQVGEQLSSPNSDTGLWCKVLPPLPRSCTVLRGTTSTAQWLKCWYDNGNFYVDPIVDNDCDIYESTISLIATTCSNAPYANLQSQLGCVIDQVQKYLTSSSLVCRHYAKCTQEILTEMNVANNYVTRYFSDPIAQGHGWNKVLVSGEEWFIDSYNDSLFYCSYFIPICGNGAVETGEECDDGNNIDGDGCSKICIIEAVTPPPPPPPPTQGTLTINITTMGGNANFIYSILPMPLISIISTVDGIGTDSISLDTNTTYNLAETFDEGWTQDSATCDNGTPSSVVIYSGSTTSCNFSYSYTPSSSGGDF